MAASLSLAAMSFSAEAAPIPKKIGACAASRIAATGWRLEDGRTHQPIRDSGSTVRFRNGLVQISYDDVPEIDRSRAGDPVSICLVSLPQDCPPGDERGKVYKTTNLRTRQSWTLPDSQHMCGGA